MAHKNKMTFTPEDMERFEAIIEGDGDGSPPFTAEEAAKFDAIVNPFGTDELKRSIFKVTWEDAETASNTDVREPGAMYWQAFAEAEERVAARKTAHDDEYAKWDRIDDLQDRIAHACHQIGGPGSEVEVKWREIRIRRGPRGDLVCCIPTPLLDGVAAENVPGIVRS